MIWTGGMSPPFSFVTSPKCAIPGKWRFVMEIGAFSISLAHTGSIPHRCAASGNTPIPSNRLPSRSAVILSAPLSLDGQNALKGGGGDSEPLGNCDVVLHGLGDGMTAHHQHMRAAEQVAPHVDAALMLLGNGVIEEKRLIERRADGRKARFIHRAAILRRQLCVFVVAAAPCGGDICKGSFHPENLQFYNVVGQPKPHALSHSWERGRLWRIYPRRLPEKKHSRDRRSRAGRRKRRCDAPLTARSRPCWNTGGDGGYNHKSLGVTNCVLLLWPQASKIRTLRCSASPHKVLRLCREPR